MNALLQIATANPCGDPSEPLPNKGEFNLAKNGNFNAQKDYWNPFGSGYNLVHTLSRSGSGPANARTSKTTTTTPPLALRNSSKSIK